MKTRGFWISEHFLTALVNADTSGMEQEEMDKLDRFLESNSLGHCLMPDDTDTTFCICRVTGLYSDCVYTEFYLVEKEA